MKTSPLLLAALAGLVLSSVPTSVVAAEDAWTIDLRLGLARTARTISGLPAGVAPDASSASGPYAGIGVWTSSLLPVELGSGLFFVSRSYESTERGVDFVIRRWGNEPYVSVPLLARHVFEASGLLLLAGGAVDVYPLPIEDDSRRRAILSVQAGIGFRLGRATLDARYVADVTAAVRLVADEGTIEESYDGFLLTLSYDVFTR